MLGSRNTRSFAPFAFAWVLLAGAAGCGDIGDPNAETEGSGVSVGCLPDAGPSEAAAGDPLARDGAKGVAPLEAGPDAPATFPSDDGGSTTGDDLDGGPSGLDTGAAPTGEPETGSPTDSSTDSAALDSGGPDAGLVDATVESGTFDAGATDAGASDSGLDAAQDGGPRDAGPLDARASDGAPSDAAAPDATVPEAGPADAGAADTGGGSATCSGNTGGTCTATERLLAQHSPDCYACLLEQGCIDDDQFGDKGFECGDVAGNAAGGTSRTQLCLDTLTCILGTACARSGIGSCYCGDLVGTACSNPSGQNGKCLAAEQAGLESTDPNTILNNYSTNSSLGGSVANAIFQCAFANLEANSKCAACAQ